MKRSTRKSPLSEGSDVTEHLWWQETEEGVVCRVRVTPKASKNELTGISQGSLAIRLTAPPVEGKANKALMRFLSEIFGVSQSAVRIIRGQSARDKTVLIAGVTKEGLLKLLD